MDRFWLLICHFYSNLALKVRVVVGLSSFYGVDHLFVTIGQEERIEIWWANKFIVF